MSERKERTGLRERAVVEESRGGQSGRLDEGGSKAKSQAAGVPGGQRRAQHTCNQLGCWPKGLMCGTPLEGPRKPHNAAVEGLYLPASTRIALCALGNFHIFSQIPQGLQWLLETHIPPKLLGVTFLPNVSPSTGLSGFCSLEKLLPSLRLSKCYSGVGLGGGRKSGGGSKWSPGPAEVLVSALCSPSHRPTCLPSWRPPLYLYTGPCCFKGEPRRPWLSLLGTDGPEKLTASASRTGNPPRAKESGNPSCPLRDSGSPSSLENPPPQPLSRFLCLSPSLRLL